MVWRARAALSRPGPGPGREPPRVESRVRLARDHSARRPFVADERRCARVRQDQLLVVLIVLLEELVEISAQRVERSRGHPSSGPPPTGQEELHRLVRHQQAILDPERETLVELGGCLSRPSIRATAAALSLQSERWAAAVLRLLRRSGLTATGATVKAG